MILKKILRIFILSISLFSVSSFSQNISETKVLNIAQEADPKIFDPHFANDGFSLRINKLLYSQLFEKDANMNTVNSLVKSYKINDSKTITFTLKDDIYFQNGEKLTSEDVKFSFERMKTSPRIFAFLPPIENIEIIDEKSFIMNLSSPFSSIIDQLTHPALSIVSKKYLENNSNILLEKPMGSGKYHLKKWIPGEKVILEKNDNYFSSSPTYDIINIKSIPLATNRTIALETSEADIALSIPVQDRYIIEKNPDLEYLTKPSYSYTYLGLNLKKEVFKDINIRKAIDLAIDKKTILEVVLNNEGSIANSPVAKGVVGYNRNLKPTEYNKKLAKNLLNNKKITLSLATLNNNIDVQTAEIIAGNLKEIGIDVNISVLEGNMYWVKTNLGEFDMFLGSWGSVTGEADYALFPTHHSSSFGAAGNRTFFSDEKVDKLLEKARDTLDKDSRNKIYAEIQEIIVDNHSEVMLFYRDLNAGINKKIKGFELYPIPIHDFSSGDLK